MPFSPTSPYHTPTPTAITNTFIIPDRNNPTSVRSATQPIPVKMVMSNVHVEPQQGVLIDTSSNNPTTPSIKETSTYTSNTVLTGKNTDGNVGVGATNGNGDSGFPRFVPQQASTSLSPQHQHQHQQQHQLFPPSSSSSFFDSDKRGKDSSPVITSTTSTPSSTSSDKAVEATITKPKSATLSIIPSPHDNNKPLKSIVGIPCLVKQQSPGIKITSSEGTGHATPINESILNSTSKPSSSSDSHSTTWINLLNTLKDQIQQIQHERQQEKMAYLVKEMERRELEQKMLDEIQKTGEQLAMFSQQLEDRQLDKKQHPRYRSKSAERQPSVGLDIGDEAGKDRPGNQRRPHSFSLSTTTSIPLEFKQQNDYHSAIEDDSDHDTKSTKGKGKSRKHDSRSSLIPSSSSSSSSSASADDISFKDLLDIVRSDDSQQQRQSRNSSLRRQKPSHHHHHRQRNDSRQSRGQDSPSQSNSSSKPPIQQQKRKSQYTSTSSSPTLQYYTWTNPGYYHPPPPIHPSHLPPLSNQYLPHLHGPWAQQMHGSTNRNYSNTTIPASYYTFPSMIPPPPNSNDQRRYPPSSNTSALHGHSANQNSSQALPPSSHTSTTSSTQYRPHPPSSSSSSHSFPHRLTRHPPVPLPPSFHHPSLFIPPHLTEKSGLFM